MNDDELLLRQLAVALATQPRTPPATGLQVLHQSIDANRGAPQTPRRSRRRWLVPVVATVAALGVGNLALAAAGTSLPRVVRAVAHDVALPVDSPALLDTRQHRDALRAALERDELTTIEAEARQLRAAFARLDSGERNAVAVDVQQLLARADSRLAEGAADTTSTTHPPLTTSEAPAIQTHTTDNDANGSGSGSDQSGHDTTTDTSRSDGTTVSDGSQGSVDNQDGATGHNLDNGQPGSDQQNGPIDQSGSTTTTTTEGNASD